MWDFAANYLDLSKRWRMRRIYSVAILVSGILFSRPFGLSGRAMECHFSRLSSEDGLSHNTVVSIVQDRDGNIWAGTHDGLDRYDGYDISIYRNETSDSTSIQSNIINKVYRDSKDGIWVCTANGLCLYDKMADCFRRLRMSGVHSIEDMVEICDGRYLLTTRSASFIYDSETGSVEEFCPDGSPFRFYSSCRDGDRIVLCGMFRTVETMRWTGETLVREYPPVKISSFGRSVVPAGNDSYLVSSGSSILKVNVKTGEIAEMLKRPESEVMTIATDRDGYIWTGWTDGLTAYSGSECIYDSWSSASVDKTVICLFFDCDGGLWVGTEYGGIKYWNSGKDRFNSVRFNDSPDELRTGVTTCLGCAPDGRVWIGSRYEGLSAFNPESGSRVRYDIDNARCLYFSEDRNTVYVGAEMNGLTIIDIGRGRCTHLSRPADVIDICEAKQGRLWVGTLIGLYLFSPEDGSYAKMKLPFSELVTRILTLFEDSSGNLWVGSKESLRVYRVGEDNSLEDISPSCLKDIIQVQCVHQTEDGTLWIGTADGLVTFKWGDACGITRVGGLQGSTIRGIEEDDNANLWISTDNYLCRYNAATGERRIYTVGDALQCSQFKTGAHCKTPDGTLYFGGIKGVVFFRPEDMRNNTSTVAPVLTGFMLNNKDVLPVDDTGILSCCIRYAKEITLKHYQNSITFRFSCPDFISEHGNSFRYMLEGFDSNWIAARNREATYSNLDKGSYVFKVMAANSDGIWHPEAAAINVRVLPVWYRTVFAKIVFSLIVLSILASAGIMILRKINLRHEIRIREMSREYEDKIHRARMARFIDPEYQLRSQDEAFLTSVLASIENSCSCQGEICI